MPQDQRPKKTRQGISLDPDHQVMLAELAGRAHGGNASAYLRDMISRAHRGEWPPVTSARILEELIGYLHSADQPGLVAELERLGLRDQQRVLLDRLLTAYRCHLSEIETGEDTSHLTRLGVYVCRSRDFFRDRTGGGWLAAEDRPGQPRPRPDPPSKERLA